MEETYRFMSLGSTLPGIPRKTVKYLPSDPVSVILEQFTNQKKIDGNEVVLLLTNSIEGNSFVLIGTDNLGYYEGAMGIASTARVTTQTPKEIEDYRNYQFKFMEKYRAAHPVRQKPPVVAAPLPFFEEMRKSDTYKDFMEMKVSPDKATLEQVRKLKK